MGPVARRLSHECGVLEPLETARSAAGQIEELRRALSEHSQTPAVLIGYSWGAWLSLLTAARHPELCGKLILVSCPPFAAPAAAELRARRLDRLDDAEKAEYEAALASLGDPAAPESDHLLETLGRLAAKADAYSLIDETDEPAEVRVDAGIYRAVWKEAAAMRRSGELLRQVQMVRCPVVAVHGDADSAPVEAVAEPLAAALTGFRMIVLPRCGHTPWLERYAQEQFYRTLLDETR
jgi:pimeloyl-ACP methyl ester carboxylesterase